MSTWKNVLDRETNQCYQAIQLNGSREVLKALVERYVGTFKIEPNQYGGVVIEESKFNPSAVSRDFNLGLHSWVVDQWGECEIGLFGEAVFQIRFSVLPEPVLSQGIFRGSWKPFECLKF